MGNADLFVKNNFSDINQKFLTCIEAILYGYFLFIKSQNTYSRKEIAEIASRVRGKKTDTVELEDFIRHDLVTNFINPNRNRFGLEYFSFNSGVEEFNRNVKLGILDIKVTNPTLNDNYYFIFECKRLNKDITSNYVNDGIKRFITKQYYPETEINLGGMIAFLEYENIKKMILLDDSFNSLERKMNATKDSTKLVGKLEKYKINSEEQEIDNFKYLFKSRHNLEVSPFVFNLFHIILDYNTLISE